MSNQEAIALLRNLEDSLDSYCGLSEEGKTAFRMAIEALNSLEIPNSSDTISRAKAIEAIDEIESEIAEGFGFEYEKWRKYFCDLPPAQPKRGRWIGKYPVTSVCSECGFLIHDSKVKAFAYCPNCGAEMEKEVIP